MAGSGGVAAGSGGAAAGSGGVEAFSASFHILYSLEVPMPNLFRMAAAGMLPREATISPISFGESSLDGGILYIYTHQKAGLVLFDTPGGPSSNLART